ncbi:MAG: histidine kinase [Bacteroidetes bacterium]|nr:histidine kinase [Bacteroidota bacterium]
MLLHVGLAFVQERPTNIYSLAQPDNQVERVLLFALIPVVVAFSFFVFIFYRARREAAFREKETALKLSIAEGELKALRAQMDPHFIFNCLNSIHHYMHTNQAHAADYLIKFSQLIRHVLESSALRMVSLADEIEANRNYMLLEQLRLNQRFQFSIEISDELNADAVQIPPMVIQPFIENSIWHGLNQRSEGGKIHIHFSKKDERHIQCTICDNGKEESEKSEIDLSNRVKKSSMGMNLIQERLKNLNTLYHSDARFVLTKNTNEGKSITLSLPFQD